MSGIAKLAAGALAAAAVAAVLVVLTHRARTEGRLAYCRSNLVHLGRQAYSMSAANWEAQRPEERGRAFWQSLREFLHYDTRAKKWMRIGQLNPFQCPVRGAGPVNFDLLDDAAFAKYMNDPATIDYRGPSELPERPGKVVLGADRDGNHRDGGYVLLADFSEQKVSESAKVSTEWALAGQTRD